VTSKARQGIPDALCRLPVKGPHSDLNRAASKCTAHDRHLKDKRWECSVGTTCVHGSPKGHVAGIHQLGLRVLPVFRADFSWN